MSDTFERVQKLIQQGNIKISDHGYDELADDGILAGDALRRGAPTRNNR